MARASFRRRPDGIPEIVRARRLREWLVPLGAAVGVLALAPALFAAAAVYFTLGVPLLAGIAIFLGARALHRRARRPLPVPPVALRVVRAPPLRGEGGRGR
ncbi:MAG TPA: hypothetical protein VFP65_07220 [Anaeromyxobacteraceae bacterium]|nr:hypothetical protein [Anaeromyxobacteraceae bacterium]